MIEGADEVGKLPDPDEQPGPDGDLAPPSLNPDEFSRKQKEEEGAGPQARALAEEPLVADAD